MREVSRNEHRPRVVIVGAGFGGLWAARTLAHHPVEVLLVDRNNYHTFLPLLYQVAAAELEPEGIAYPIRSILRKVPNVRFSMGRVNTVDLGQRVVTGDGFAFPYDFLILAMGSVSHYFRIPGAEDHALPLQTMEEAIHLRNHLLKRFEQAVGESEPVLLQRALTFAIVGGGPTGVEFAGALAELIRGPLVKDYPSLDFDQVRILLLEAQGSLLSHLPESLRAYALAQLEKKGVQVRLLSTVSRITPRAVHLDDGTIIPSETVIWTAGVQGDPVARTWGLPADRGGRIAVLPTLQVSGHPEVYVVGDLASIEQHGQLLPMIAPVAIQQGIAAAKNIARQTIGQDPLPFLYRDRGTMATIGRNAAVAQLRGRTFSGFPAWMLWLGVHLFNLIGFRNRLFVLINWAWDYFHERPVRLILPTGQTKR